MSKNKNEEGLLGWAAIIKEEGKRFRNEQLLIQTEKATEILSIFDKQYPIDSTDLLVWKENIPYLTKSTPANFLTDHQILAMIWDEMNHRKNWLKEFESWIDQCKGLL